jgi:hypothetical protein
MDVRAILYRHRCPGARTEAIIVSLKTQVLFLPRSYRQEDTRETDQGQRTRTAAVPDPVSCFG